MKLASVENPNAETISELTEAQRTFTLVLSADYQQSKLIPHWGQSEQPGSTYYLQKLSFDIFGLVDHRDNLKDITIFDETIGPKNTDHTISFLSRYITQVRTDHPWIKHACIFLDNPGSTNKDRYLFSREWKLLSSVYWTTFVSVLCRLVTLSSAQIVCSCWLPANTIALMFLHLTTFIAFALTF